MTDAGLHATVHAWGVLKAAYQLSQLGQALICSDLGLGIQHSLPYPACLSIAKDTY